MKNVEINLLPEKPAKRRLLLYIFSSLIIVLLLLFIPAFIYQQNLESQKERLEDEIHNLTLRQEAKSSESTGTGSEERRLDEKIESLESVNRSTVRLLNNLTSQLPERGFFLRFEYEDFNAVTLDVQFDTQREAAGYLRALNRLPVVQDAMIDEINTEELGDGTGEADEDALPRYHAVYSIVLDGTVFSNEAKWDDLMESAAEPENDVSDGEGNEDDPEEAGESGDEAEFQDDEEDDINTEDLDDSLNNDESGEGE